MQKILVEEGPPVDPWKYQKLGCLLVNWHKFGNERGSWEDGTTHGSFAAGHPQTAGANERSGARRSARSPTVGLGRRQRGKVLALPAGRELRLDSGRAPAEMSPVGSGRRYTAALIDNSSGRHRGTGLMAGDDGLYVAAAAMSCAKQHV